MIKVEINKDKCEIAEVEGTPSQLATEASIIVSDVYKGILEGAMTSDELKSNPKPYIHKQIRELFLKSIATAFALVDSDVIEKYIGDTESQDFLSEFMQKLMGEEDDEH